jgi:hypothetical protein
MRRASHIPPACAVLALVLVFAGCGGQKRTIPTGKAQSMLAQLDAIGGEFDSKSCASAHDRAVSLENEARGLSSRVDATVKRNLISGAQRLDALVRRDCEKPKPTQTNTTTTNTTTTNTTPTNTTPTTPTNTTPTNTTPTNTTPTTGGGGGVTVPGTTGAGGALLQPGGGANDQGQGGANG